MRIIQRVLKIISKNAISNDKEYIKIKKPKNKNWSNKKMNDLYQGVLAIVLIAFFIIVAIVVNTPALTGTSIIQFPEQEEIIIENETAPNNTTAAINNNSSNNTE